MENNQEKVLTRKFGLFATTCLVVGTIIGSGIFIKSEEMAAAIGGRLWYGIFAWALGGGIMFTFAYTFSRLASRHEKINGLIDYSEAVVGKRYGYALGWYMATIYGPALMAFLAHATARFTVALFGWEGVNQFFSAETFMLAGVFLVLANVNNMLTPKLSLRFNITTTFLRIVPLIAMGIIGTIVGLVTGTTAENLQSAFMGTAANPFLAAVFATAFAFAGWESTLSLNSEVKDGRRTLPLALLLGTCIVIGFYVLYYIGMYGAVDPETMAAGGAVAGGTRQGFENIFHTMAGPILFAFIIISCFGALNGFTMAHHRGMYSLARRNRGPAPHQFVQLDNVTQMPVNSGLMSMVLSMIWLFVFGGHQAGWYSLPISGLAVVFYNLTLFPILVGMMLKQKDLNAFDRFVMPLVTISGGILMLVSAWLVVRAVFIYFAVIAFAVVALGMIFYSSRGKRAENAIT